MANPSTQVYPLAFFLRISFLMMVAAAMEASVEVGKKRGSIFSMSENLGNLER